MMRLWRLVQVDALMLVIVLVSRQRPPGLGWWATWRKACGELHRMTPEDVRRMQAYAAGQRRSRP